MARPQAFDRQQALRAALQVFWKQGYASTSMADLLQAMGLSRSSLYASYGDKRQLFIEALDLFAKSAQKHFRAIESLDDPREIVRTFLRTSFDVECQELKLGCMLVNTVLELAGVDEELAQLANSKIALIEKLLEQGFVRAQQAGKLSPHHNPLALSRLLMTVSQGLRVSARVSDKSHIDEVVDTIMGLLKV